MSKAYEEEGAGEDCGRCWRYSAVLSGNPGRGDEMVVEELGNKEAEGKQWPWARRTGGGRRTEGGQAIIFAHAEERLAPQVRRTKEGGEEANPCHALRGRHLHAAIIVLE